MRYRTVWLASMVLTIALFLPSCTHKPYHPTKNDREWTIDHEICERWAREGIRDNPDTYDYFDEMKMIKACMRSKGWEWERTSLLDFSKEEAE